MSNTGFQLKPCPFCGGKAHVYIDPAIWMDTSYSVGCKSCTARQQGFSSKEGAVVAWNRRAEPELEQSEERRP